MVDLLSIIVYGLDSNGYYLTDIDNYMATFNYQDSVATTANAQIVNGAYRTTELATVLAYELLD